MADAGRVVLHGCDTATADRAALRRQVAVVFQDFIRYALPARANIALGRRERYSDDGAVASAAGRAGIDADLRELPRGFETQLGPGLRRRRRSLARPVAEGRARASAYAG